MAQRRRGARHHDQAVDQTGRHAIRSDAIFHHVFGRDRVGRLDQLARLLLVELGVGGLDQQEELVVRDAIEAPHLVERVRRMRQSVDHQHADQRRDGAEQHRELEHDRHVGRDAPVRLAADQPRVVVGVHPPLHRDRGG